MFEFIFDEITLNLSGHIFHFMRVRGFESKPPLMIVNDCAVSVSELVLPCGVVISGDALKKLIDDKIKEAKLKRN